MARSSPTALERGPLMLVRHPPQRSCAQHKGSGRVLGQTAAGEAGRARCLGMPSPCSLQGDCMPYQAVVILGPALPATQPLPDQRCAGIVPNLQGLRRRQAKASAYGGTSSSLDPELVGMLIAYGLRARRPSASQITPWSVGTAGTAWHPGGHGDDYRPRPHPPTAFGTQFGFCFLWLPACRGGAAAAQPL